MSARSLGAALRPFGVALLLGAATALVSACFLGAVHLLEHLLWDVLPQQWSWWGQHRATATVLTCSLGGVLVGLVNRGGSPAEHGAEGAHDLEESLEVTGHPPTGAPALLRLATLGMVSLGFGAALGPEAPLIALVAGLAANLQGVLRVARDEAVQLSVSAALGGLFGAPLGAAALPVEHTARPLLWERVHRIAPSILAGVTGLVVLLWVLPEGSLSPLTFPDETVTEVRPGVELLAWVGAALAGALAGRGLLWAIPVLQRLAARAFPVLPVRGLAGGVALGLLGAITPLALFSGHEGIQEVYAEVDELTVLTLLGLALVKSLAMLACLATGWFGGQVFPAAMVGTTLGLVVGAAVGGDAAAGAAGAGLVATAAVLLQRPLAALLIFVFFLPLGTLVAASIGAAVAAAVLAMIREPAAEGSATGQ